MKTYKQLLEIVNGINKEKDGKVYFVKVGKEPKVGEIETYVKGKVEILSYKELSTGRYQIVAKYI